MRRSPHGSIFLGLMITMIVVTGMACSGDDGANGPELSLNNCESCHTDGARILMTADPEAPGSENPGEG